MGVIIFLVLCLNVIGMMCVLGGFAMGGKLGVITVITAVTAGPMIQMFTKIFSKSMML